MLYQLSYSREQTTVPAAHFRHGGEGNRTPDLLNAIQALSQLSYTPGTFPDGPDIARQEPRRISKGSIEVKKIALVKTPAAGILQRFYSQKFSIREKRFCCRVFRAVEPTIIRSHLLALTGCIRIGYHGSTKRFYQMAEVKRRRKTTVTGIAPSEPERDILDQYLYEVSTYPLLKGTEEIDVARRIRAGDPDALQELVQRNLRFVISVAKKYQNRGMPLIDLIGEGNVGLLTAARKFDPDQGVKFISYAVWWIRQAILSSLARQGRTVRVPLNRTADLSRIIKASEILRQKMRREPTPEELSQLTGLSVDVVQSLAALNTGDVRLDAPMDPEGDRSLIERFVADEMPDTEEEAMNRFLNDEIETALSTLPPRDAKVLRLYFGLEGGREHTLEEIGSLLGVTRERVRQLRDRALKRLREGDVGRALGSFAA